MMSDEKAALIMTHAQMLFIEHGFHGTSMQMIAKAAGIAAGTVYVHFPSKEELIRAIYRQVVIETIDCLLIDFDMEAPPFEQYSRFWKNAREGLATRMELIHFKELYERSPFFNDDDRVMNDEKWLHIEEFYQRGIDIGLFRNMPTCLLGYLSLGSVLSIPHTQRVEPFEMTPELESEMIRASWTAILAEEKQ